MGRLIPGQAIIYEQADGVIYARYRDPPYNSVPRWEVGSVEKKTVSVSYLDFQRMREIAKHHEGFRDAWEQMLAQYFLLKDIDLTDEDR